MFNLLNDISKKEFLAYYWEKKPLVIRGAISKEDAESIVSIDDLMTMASDNYYETRSISKENNNWLVETGPFRPNKFKDKSKFWTLIAHNINLYFPKGRLLERAVEFIPKWLFDDVMCTYSTKGSTVGAHIDNYNVFILQGAGQRSWEIQYNPNKAYQEGLEVKILKEFTPDETYILNPGDLIYIPPHIAHAGTSLTESVSLSIGFKSLEDKAMLDSVATTILEDYDSQSFYKTRFESAQENPFELSSKLTEKIKERLTKELFSESFFKSWLPKFLSQSKSFVPSEDNADVEFEEFKELITQMDLARDEHTKLVVQANNICINGQSFESTPEQIALITELFDLDPNTGIPAKKTKNQEKYFYQLFTEGYFYLQEES